MPVHNADIAAIFEEIADLLEIQGENPFRIRAYRNAAREMQSLGVPASEMVAKGEDLTELPGIGDDLAAKIREIVETGKCKALEKLRAKFPPTITTLLKLPGLGPKRVKMLYDETRRRTRSQHSSSAARAGLIRELPGFGEKTEAAILEALAQHAEEATRFKLAIAAQYAEPLVAYLGKSRNVKQVVIAGSYRRFRETVGDLDILVTTKGQSDVMERFVAYDEVREVHGPRRHARDGATPVRPAGGPARRAAGIVRRGTPVLHRLQGAQHRDPPPGPAEKAQDQRIRRVSRQQGASPARPRSRSIAAVELPWIPPELRENRGEIEAARKGKLPELVELKDLRGDLHAHTKATDGHHTLREMAEAARKHGFEYLAITEHSRRLTVAHGLDVHGLRKQMEEIDRLNEKLSGITLLKGIEVDILEDGSLDLPDEVLGRVRSGGRRGAQQVPSLARQADRAHPQGHGPSALHHPRPPHRPAARKPRAL